MADDESKEKFVSLISTLIRSEDRSTYESFSKTFPAEADAFVEHMAATLVEFSALCDRLSAGDTKKLRVTAILHDAINQHIVSFQLFLSGQLVAAGALFRMVLEYVALSILCSAKELSVLDKFESDKYSTQDAVQHLGKFAEKAGVKKDAVKQIKSAYKFLHMYAHPTKLTIAAGTSFHAGGYPMIGAHFDPDKINEYRKEATNRVGLASVFPGAVELVNRNLAKW